MIQKSIPTLTRSFSPPDGVKYGSPTECLGGVIYGCFILLIRIPFHKLEDNKDI